MADHLLAATVVPVRCSSSGTCIVLSRGKPACDVYCAPLLVFKLSSDSFFHWEQFNYRIDDDEDSEDEEEDEDEEEYQWDVDEVRGFYLST